jgi:hypothetical protein
VPPQLVWLLPAAFPFTYKNVEYTWHSFNFPTANNVWQTKTLGILMFDYSQRPEMADPMLSYHRPPGTYWGPEYFYFVYGG